MQEQYLLIPPERISKEALHALVEEFILREGTDYGHSEVTLDEKVKRVFKQIDSKRVVIMFSTFTENTTLLRCEEFQKLQKTTPSES